MELAKDIIALDLGTYHLPTGTLCMSDFHIGYEAELIKKGVLVPKVQFKDIIDRLTWMFRYLKKEKLDLNVIILNGDLKHSFGEISRQEWSEITKLLDFMQRYCSKIIIVKGNHDVILGPILKKHGIKSVVDYRVGDVLYAHGDDELSKEQLKGVKTIVIGHDHPAILLRDKAKREKFKCFIKGKYKRKTLIVQPSVQPLIEGTNVLENRMLSPLLPDNLGKFEVFVVNDKEHKVLYFGKIKDHQE